MEIQRILLIGCGKMGRILACKWLESDILQQLWIADPAGVPEDLADLAKVKPWTGEGQPDAIVIAIKPQQFSNALPLYQPLMDGNPLLVSIAAGVPVARIRELLPGDGPVVRAMPNTPAAVGQGITALFADGLTEQNKPLVASLFDKIGKACWLEEQQQMHAVTAVSGSGPAYVFMMTECLAAAAVNQGLPTELADELARQTVIGSGALLSTYPHLTPETLRKTVTSPGGTTEAGLGALQPGLHFLLSDTVEAAAQRSRELSEIETP